MEVPVLNRDPKVLRHFLYQRLTASGIISVRSKEGKLKLVSSPDELFNQNTFSIARVGFSKHRGETNYLFALRSVRGALVSPMEIVPLVENFPEDEIADEETVAVVDLSETNLLEGADHIDIAFTARVSDFMLNYPDAVNLLQ